MKNKNRVNWLRVSYRVGAVADFLAAIVMLSPKLGKYLYGSPSSDPGTEFRYAMGLGASLMFGWTFLLLWADRKPLERKGILILTIFPVIFGLIISGIYAVITNLVAIERMIPTWIFQVALIALFSFSYFNSRNGEQ
ncbi:hypothetical protein ACFL4G_06750 [Thermodesulfobacteriota bacterium]